MQDRSARPAAATTGASVVQSALCNTDTNTSTYTCTFSSTPIFGDEALVLIGSSTIASVTSGYSSVGTAASSTSRVSAYFASTATKSFTVTFSSASDVHIAMLELANAGTPTTFSSASGESAPKVTATANAIVVDMFGEQYGYPYYGTIPSGWTEYYPPSPNSAGSGSNQLDSLIDVGSTANSSYGLADSPYLVSASFQVPTKTSTATPSPAPTSTASPRPYDSLKKISPAGGSFSYYPTSPFHATMPPSPALVSTSQSAAWNGMQNSQGFGAITDSENGSNVNDGSDPTTYTNGDGTGYMLQCNKYGFSQYSCQSPANTRNINGAIVKFPLAAITAGDSDHHLVNIDVAANIEDNIWEGQPIPAAGGTWSVGGGGECNLSGNGVGCGGAVATNIAVTLGLVRPEDILYCLQKSLSPSTCTLPYAMSIAVACNGANYEFPATASDNQCGGGAGTSSTRIAEGTRGCLNMTDAQINAGSYRQDEKVIYRTMDCSHYGFFDRDSAYGSGPGYALQYQGGEAYTPFGETDPWSTVASLVGISMSNSTDYVFPITLTNPPFVWCANGKNDGLCD